MDSECDGGSSEGGFSFWRERGVYIYILGYSFYERIGWSFILYSFSEGISIAGLRGFLF